MDSPHDLVQEPASESESAMAYQRQRSPIAAVHQSCLLQLAYIRAAAWGCQDRGLVVRHTQMSHPE